MSLSIPLLLSGDLHTTHFNGAVSRLIGRVQLGFSRQPFSHWSLTFTSTPQMEVDVTSRVAGRSFSHVTQLVASQVSQPIHFIAFILFHFIFIFFVCYIFICIISSLFLSFFVFIVQLCFFLWSFVPLPLSCPPHPPCLSLPRLKGMIHLKLIRWKNCSTVASDPEVDSEEAHAADETHPLQTFLSSAGPPAPTRSVQDMRHTKRNAGSNRVAVLSSQSIPGRRWNLLLASAGLVQRARGRIPHQLDTTLSIRFQIIVPGSISHLQIRKGTPSWTSASSANATNPSD